MFEYKCTTSLKGEYGSICLLNLAYVLLVSVNQFDKNFLDITMTTGYTVTLANNWKDRDDVARFKDAMTVYSGVKWE